MHIAQSLYTKEESEFALSCAVDCTWTSQQLKPNQLTTHLSMRLLIAIAQR